MREVATEPSDKEAAVLAALGKIIDPCMALSGKTLSILDMGLINTIEETSDGVIEVRITYTEPTCTFAYRIIGALEDLHKDIPGVTAVKVISEPLPQWGKHRLSRKARKLFSSDSKAFWEAKTPNLMRRKRP